MSLLQAIYIYFLSPILSFIILLVIIRVVLSWLIGFNVINGYNRFIAMIDDMSRRLTDPLLRPIQNMLPPVGGMDISPIILLLALYFTKDWLLKVLVFGGFRLF